MGCVCHQESEVTGETKERITAEFPRQDQNCSYYRAKMNQAAYCIVNSAVWLVKGGLREQGGYARAAERSLLRVTMPLWPRPMCTTRAGPIE